MKTTEHADDFAGLTAEIGEATCIAEGLALLLDAMEGGFSPKGKGLAAAAAIARKLQGQLDDTFIWASSLNERTRQEAPGDTHG